MNDLANLTDELISCIKNKSLGAWEIQQYMVLGETGYTGIRIEYDNNRDDLAVYTRSDFSEERVIIYSTVDIITHTIRSNNTGVKPT